jgi:hypothetical protein
MIGEESSNVSEAVSLVIHVGLPTVTRLIAGGDFIVFISGVERAG